MVHTAQPFLLRLVLRVLHLHVGVELSYYPCLPSPCILVQCLTLAAFCYWLVCIVSDARICVISPI